MFITPMANAVFRVVRPTAILVSRQDAAATITCAVTPESPAFCEVQMWGSTLTGVVTAEGTDEAGAPYTEDLAISQAGSTGIAVARSARRFASFTQLTLTDLADEVPTPQIQARAVDVGGEPLKAYNVLVERMRARIDPTGSAGGWPWTPAGGAEKRPSKVGFDNIWGYRPRVGDLLVQQIEEDGALVDQHTWRIVSVPDYLGTYRAVTFEPTVELLDGQPIPG